MGLSLAKQLIERNWCVSSKVYYFDILVYFLSTFNSMPLSINWSRTLVTSAEQHVGGPPLPGFLHEKKMVTEDTIYVF